MKISKRPLLAHIIYLNCTFVHMVSTETIHRSYYSVLCLFPSTNCSYNRIFSCIPTAMLLFVVRSVKAVSIILIEKLYVKIVVFDEEGMIVVESGTHCYCYYYNMGNYIQNTAVDI